MLEMLKERKEALEAQGKKGFTLMEMLIVIAIIAILIAIAIPIFSGQLEQAREATDLSNCRSYYSEVVTAIATGDLDESTDTITVQGLTASTSGAKGVAAGETFDVTVTGVTIQQSVDNWQTASPQCAGVALDPDLTVAPTMNITYTFEVQDDGDVLLTTVAFAS